jgi:hypothetical protein
MSIAANLLTGEPRPFWQYLLVFALLALIHIAADYADRYFAYERSSSRHFETTKPIIKLALERIHTVWGEMSQKILDSDEILQLACLQLSADQRSWELLVDYNTGDKHQLPLDRARTWLAIISGSQYDGKPQGIELNEKLKIRYLIPVNVPLLRM